jgi:hypothetical protein
VACLACHTAFAAPAVAADHSRHSDRVTCLDCHMPRTVPGVETITRTHRVGRAVEPGTAERGGFNACNLCHLDRPLSWTLTELEAGWGRRPSTQAERRTLSPVPAGELWLGHADPAVRRVAVDAHVRSPLVADPLPALLGSLNDPVPFNRTLGLIALERHVGFAIEPRAYDPLPGQVAWEAQVERLAASLRSGRTAAP